MILETDDEDSISIVIRIVRQPLHKRVGAAIKLLFGLRFWEVQFDDSEVKRLLITLEDKRIARLADQIDHSDKVHVLRQIGN